MKKNFLTTVAITVVAFFVATEIAIAADINFTGQVRSRFEMNEQSDFDDDTDANDFIATRVRLNANVNINDSTSAFIQMQSSRVWGNDIDNTTTGGGSGNGSFTASDADASVGIHEAYFTLKNFAGMSADLKLGRQQIVIDGHRLFGHTGWTTGAQTHDAIRLTHKGGNHTLNYSYIIANEGGVTAEFDNTDIEVHLLHANFKGIMGGGLSAYGVFSLDNCGNTAANTCVPAANNIYTVGFRQAGQLFGIDYRGEYYHQWGEARADATATAALFTDPATADIDRDAYMFGVRIGKKFNNVAMKPSLTFWYDQLSGTDDGNISANEWGTFNTLFDTGHKFYGHMDLFLSSVNHGTQGLGLHDAAIKASLQPMPGWTVKAAYHWFETDTLTTGAKALSAGTVDEDLGTEMDLTIIHKYNANTKIVAGYSVFTADKLFNDQRQSTDDADWAWIMFDVKF